MAEARVGTAVGQPLYFLSWSPIHVVGACLSGGPRQQQTITLAHSTSDPITMTDEHVGSPKGRTPADHLRVFLLREP